MSKPTVHFIGEPTFLQWEELETALVHALDHPRLGQDIIRTSLIVQKNEDGSFETLNTLYVPQLVAKG